MENVSSSKNSVCFTVFISLKILLLLYFPLAAQCTFLPNRTLTVNICRFHTKSIFLAIIKPFGSRFNTCRMLMESGRIYISLMIQ